MKLPHRRQFLHLAAGAAALPAVSPTGMGAPAGTPLDIINRLNSEINAGVSDPRMRGRIAELGAAPQIGSPNDYAKFIDSETDKWGKVVRAANIKVE